MIQEQELLAHLKAKETREAGFRELVGQYKERLYWHIRRIVLDHDDADDVLQNTFIKVHRYIDAFKGDSKLYTWLYRIATNEALTFLKKKAKRNHLTSEQAQQQAFDKLKSDVYFEGDTIQLKLQQAVAALPEKQRLVFTMKYFDGHTYEELSDILETSVGGLKSNYHIASHKIKEFLSENETF